MPSTTTTAPSNSPILAPPAPPHLNLPPGSTFDIIPSVLSALQTLLQSTSGSGSSEDSKLPAFATPTPTGATNTTSISGAPTNSSNSANAIGATASSSSPSATATAQHTATSNTTTSKDLPSLIVAVKQRIAAARVAVAELPDVDRTVEEQKEEIAEVEARIARLKEIWEGVVRGDETLEQPGADAVDGDGQMQGVAGV